MVNGMKVAISHYKLLPTLKYGDRASYCAIVTGKPPEGVESKSLGVCLFDCSTGQSYQKSDDIDPNRLFNVLMTSLQVVFINLSPEQASLRNLREPQL